MIIQKTLFLSPETAILLQGGYDMKGLSESVTDSFNGVLNLQSMDKFNPALLRDEPLEKVQQTLQAVKAAHGL